MTAILDSMSLSKAFDELMQQRAHIVLVVNEYGGMAGILTLEDVIETLLGLEIVDEGDKAEDMQKWHNACVANASRKWAWRLIALMIRNKQG